MHREHIGGPLRAVGHALSRGKVGRATEPPCPEGRASPPIRVTVVAAGARGIGHRLIRDRLVVGGRSSEL